MNMMIFLTALAIGFAFGNWLGFRDGQKYEQVFTDIERREAAHWRLKYELETAEAEDLEEMYGE